MLFIWVMLLLQSASAPVDLWAIPAAERIAFINQKLKPEMTPNAAADIDRALAAYRSPLDLRTPEMPEAEREALGWVANSEYALLMRSDWPPDRAAAVIIWLTANQKTLDAIEAACASEHCIWPVSAGNGRISSSYAIENLVKLRRLTDLAAVKARALARAGEWDAAYAWNMRVQRIGSFVRQLPFQLAQMNGDKHTWLACDQLLAFIQREPTKAPADTVADAKSERARKCLQQVIDAYEDLCTIDYLERHFAWAANPDVDPPLAEEIKATFQFPELIREMGSDAMGFRIVPLPFATEAAYRDALLATTPQTYRPVWDRDCELWREWIAKPLPDAIRGMPELEKCYVKNSRDNPFAAYLNSANIVPLESRRIVAARTDAQIAGLECVLAIRAFHQRTGRYPNTLDNLGPGRRLPLDPFSAKPLVYRPTPDGFLLYSIGPDLKDDQGVAKHPNGEAADDVLWPPVLPEYSRE